MIMRRRFITDIRKILVLRFTFYVLRFTRKEERGKESVIARNEAISLPRSKQSGDCRASVLVTVGNARRMQ